MGDRLGAVRDVVASPQAEDPTRRLAVMATPAHAAAGQGGWLGLWNARDLGSTPAGDGHVVREGALVRSEALVRLKELDWDRVVAHGVRTVVDLRTSQEAAEKPSAPRGVDVDVVNVALEEGSRATSSSPPGRAAG